MKKLLFICFASMFLISSCKKNLVDAPSRETKTENTQSNLVYWDDLPDEYKNAVRISPDDMISKKEGRLPVDPYKKDEIFNPFNLSAENFSITIPPYQVRKIAIGQGKYGAVSHISIWYSTGGEQSILYVVSSGGTTNTPMATYTLSNGEYIKGFSGRSNNGVLKSLAIYTNRGSVSNSTSTEGTYFSAFATSGSFIGEFSGNVGTMVSQLKATSYFLPWQKVSANNAVDISINEAGTAYMADAAGLLYQMTNTATSWSRVIGAPSGIKRIAAHTQSLYVIADQGKIQQRINNQWSELFGGNNRRDIAVNNEGQVFTIESNGNLRVFLTNAWNQITFGISLQNVAVSTTLNARVVSNSGYIYGMAPGTSTGLSNSLASNAVDIAFGDKFWATTTSGKIQLNVAGSTWKEIAGSDAVRIDAIQNKVMMVNTQGEVYKLEY